MSDNSADLMSTMAATTIVAILNQKFAENYDNPTKADLLTEILNDIKLYLAAPPTLELH